MIFSRLYGGMGNQMFQYAFSRKLQMKYGGDLYLDVSNGTEYASVDSDRHRSSVLCEFSIPDENIYFIADRNEFKKIAGMGIKIADFLDKFPRAARKITKSNKLYRSLVRRIQKTYNKHGFFTAYDSYSEPEYPMFMEKAYVNGLFTSKSYFDDIYTELKREFEPIAKPNSENQRFLDNIGSDISVCMHVRKGSSYLDNPYLDVCSGCYFEYAMQTVEEKYPNAVFYVFSNDFCWVRNNIDLDKHRCVLVDANDSQHAVDEFRLMKACKHFILSNSTMGWWAQYLCDNQNKMVISPSTWAKGKICLLQDLIESNWVLIEV